MKDILVATAARPQDAHFDGGARKASTPMAPMAAQSRDWLILFKIGRFMRTPRAWGEVNWNVAARPEFRARTNRCGRRSTNWRCLLGSSRQGPTKTAMPSQR